MYGRDGGAAGKRGDDCKPHQRDREEHEEDEEEEDEASRAERVVVEGAGVQVLVASSPATAHAGVRASP